MDDDTVINTRTKKQEAKDGYTQLAEKMEQVRSQMIKMERKYDELYQTVKEKEFKSGSVKSDQSSPEELKSPRESVSEDNKAGRSSPEESIQAIPEKQPEESKKEMDLEKLEDNPFL